MSADQVSLLLGLLSFMAATIGVITLTLLATNMSEKLRPIIDVLLPLAFVIALVATVGSLYHSGIAHSGTLGQVSFAEADGEVLPRLDASLAADPAVGMTAPTITASYFDNSETTIDFADGQPRVVMFMAHWCPHCQAEVTALVDRFANENVFLDQALTGGETLSQ